MNNNIKELQKDICNKISGGENCYCYIAAANSANYPFEAHETKNEAGCKNLCCPHNSLTHNTRKFDTYLFEDSHKSVERHCSLSLS